MNADLSHQYAACFYAPCFLLFAQFHQIELEGLIYQATLRSGALVEPWGSRATRWFDRLYQKPFPCPAPGPLFPIFLIPSFPSSVPAAVRHSNPIPCPPLTFPPSRCTPDSLAAPKRLAPGSIPQHVPIPAKEFNLPAQCHYTPLSSLVGLCAVCNWPECAGVCVTSP